VAAGQIDDVVEIARVLSSFAADDVRRAQSSIIE
jgi:hypothetical protein